MSREAVACDGEKPRYPAQPRLGFGATSSSIAHYAGDMSDRALKRWCWVSAVATLAYVGFLIANDLHIR